MRSLSLLGLASVALSAHAAVTTYTSFAAWQAAVGVVPTTLETFSGSMGSSPDTTLNFSGFDLISVSNGGFTQYPTVALGVINLAVDGDAPTYQTFTPNVVAFGFGAEFNDANSSEGTRIVLSTGESFDVGVNDGFFGFTTDSPFASFDVVARTADGRTSGEYYYLDNVRFVNGPISPSDPAPAVPGPLAALPFALIALNRRRKRA